MLSKIVIAVALFVAVSGQGANYPAGIDPRLCPDYPNCADPAVAARSIASSFGFSSAPYTPTAEGAPLTYSAPAAAPAPYTGAAPIQYTGAAPIQYNAAAPIQYTGAAPVQYTAPAPIPYNTAAPVSYTSTAPIPHTAAAPSVPSAATHPAGVDPRVCPNYPLCDNALLAQFL